MSGYNELLLERAWVNELSAKLRNAGVPEPSALDIAFDEAWYLQTNPGVRAAVENGTLRFGFEHYLLHGHREGRQIAAGKDDLMAHGKIADFFNIQTRYDPTLVRKIRLSGIAAATSRKSEITEFAQGHNGTRYLAPEDLTVTATPIRRVMGVGSCFLQNLGFEEDNIVGCPTDFLLTNNTGQLSETMPLDPMEYDFQIVQIAFRSIYTDAGMWHFAHSDEKQYKRAFKAAVSRLKMQVHNLLAWNRRYGLPALVMNFPVPQQNPLGRLMPRYSLGNPIYFTECLNASLEKLVRGYKDAYILDIDLICASFGRRYVQDDAVLNFAHNAKMALPLASTTRIEPMLPLSDHYDIRWPQFLADALWYEAIAIYRTIRQIDTVKLVVVDLDDTLWDGVSGDISDIGPHMVEGWPLGVIEALAYLKKRGVLLAIISKNDCERIVSIWDDIMHERMPLSNFATRKINWRPKTENMQEVLAELNLLARNVVYIDDNPVERAAMQAAFPDMRILGRYPYYLRRILLWSSETQVPTITEESSRRTEMIQAQIEREVVRENLNREEFLASLDIRMNLFAVTETHAKWTRTFELLNKTNQFNTTGRRWKAEELRAAMIAGMEVFAFEVTDKFTSYGLVGVILLEADQITQLVMSCRTVGLDVEIAALAALIDRLHRQGVTTITAAFVKTNANLLCRDLFARCGFLEQTDNWSLATGSAPAMPNAVTLTLA